MTHEEKTMVFEVLTLAAFAEELAFPAALKDVLETLCDTARRIKGQRKGDGEFNPTVFFIEQSKISFALLRWKNDTQKADVLQAVRKMIATGAFEELVGVAWIVDTIARVIPKGAPKLEELQKLSRESPEFLDTLSTREDCLFLAAETYYGDFTVSMFYTIENETVRWGRTTSTTGETQLAGNMTGFLPPKQAGAQA